MTPTQMFLSQQQVCCIPISDGKGGKRQDNHHECRASEKQNECQYYFASDSAALRSCSISNSVNSSLMLIEPGPHGNHAIASQDINAGSVIVQCLPLAHSILVPPGSLMEEEESNSDDCKKRRCARCFYQEGDVDNTISEGGGGRKIKFGRCSKCRMAYYCSRSCQSDDWSQQHKLECQYYVKRRKQHTNSIQFHATSAEEDAIPLLLRTFSSLKFLSDLREKLETNIEESCNEKTLEPQHLIVSCSPTHFAKLMVSPEHNSPSHACSKTGSLGGFYMALAKELMLSFAIGGSSNKNAKNLVGAEATSDQTKAALRIWGYGPKSNIKDCHEQELYTIDQSIKRTLNAFQKNNFGIVNSLHAPIGEGVYPCAALLNHSCAPNCILRYELGRSGNLKYHPPILQIIACKDIVKGEELTHSYVDLALCTQERQSRLMETHGFECNCIRCNHTGCLVEMPEDKKDWDMWPLKNMFEKLEQARSGGNIKSTNNLVKVNLEDAMVGSSGLGKAEQFNIIQHSRTLQENANRCMMEGDEEGEMVHLSRAISLFPKRAECPAWFSPFHVQLYSIRCVYLSALLANGHIHEAVEQCEHIVSFLAVAFSHVTNHPLLGLQLYTLGDLYSGEANTVASSNTKRTLEKKANLAYTWAKQVMVITHGSNDVMVQALEDNLRRKL